MTRVRTSEVHAYGFIKEQLIKLGWIVKNPLRSKDGQVFTQNECLGEPRIAEQLGLQKPENIVKLSETNYYVIEAKSTRDNIKRAIKEAEDYAEKINHSKHISAKIISGVAGNDDEGYTVKSKFLIKGTFESVISNEKELTGLISPEIAKYLIENNTNIVEELPIDKKFFLETAEKINVILHNGAIPATDRGKVISALLLSLVENSSLNLNTSPSVLINDINTRVNAVLQKEGKPKFYDYIKISLPTTILSK